MSDPNKFKQVLTTAEGDQEVDPNAFSSTGSGLFSEHDYSTPYEETIQEQNYTAPLATAEEYLSQEGDQSEALMTIPPEGAEAPVESARPEAGDHRQHVRNVTGSTGGITDTELSRRGLTYGYVNSANGPVLIQRGAYNYTEEKPKRAGQGGTKVKIGTEMSVGGRPYRPADIGPLAVEHLMRGQEAEDHYNNLASIQEEAAEEEQRLVKQHYTKYQTEIAELETKISKLGEFVDELKHREVQPGMVFGSQWEAGLFSAIAAIAATSKDPTALGIIDKAIERSIRAQESTLAHQRAAANQQAQIYQQLRTSLKDKAAADDAYRAVLMGVYSKRIQQAQNRFTGESINRNENIFVKELEYKQSEAIARAAASAGQKIKMEFEGNVRQTQKTLQQYVGIINGAENAEHAQRNVASHARVANARANAGQRGGGGGRGGARPARRQQPSQQASDDTLEGQTFQTRDAAAMAAHQAGINGAFTVIEGRNTSGNSVFMVKAGNHVVARPETSQQTVENMNTARAQRQTQANVARVDNNSTEDAVREWNSLTPQRQNSLLDKTQAYNTLKRVRSELSSLKKDSGGNMGEMARLLPRSDLRTHLGELHNIVMNQERKKNETGVLNMSEMPFLEKGALDPNKALYGIDAMYDQVSRSIERLEAELRSDEQQYNHIKVANLPTTTKGSPE